MGDDLGLEVVRSGKGRPAMPIDVEYDRDLTAEDLQALGRAREHEGPKPYTVNRLKDRHHAAARCVASGMLDVDTAEMTGYTPVRIRELRMDPAFNELVAHYGQTVNEVWRQTHERMASLTADAINELQTRLEDDPDGFAITDLVDVAKTFADRSGHGPATKKTLDVAVNVNFGDKLAAARKRALEASGLAQPRLSNVIDAEVIEDD